ncbi:MAG: PilZ domain-containing protein [Deltaproteobacteria bacterium]|nr:PilZ domain-containing protein [Deltaproteobacteria bacterium]
MENKRRFSRVPFRTVAQVRSADGVLEMEGEVKNISLAGILLECDNSIPEGTDVAIEIFLMDGNPDFEISVKGNVVRVTDIGTAIRLNLQGIGFESLTHLRYVVSYNLGDDDTVMDEFFQHVDSTYPHSDF